MNTISPIPKLVGTQIEVTKLDHRAIGASVRAYREARGITQLQLAKALGHQYPIIVSYSESGKRTWTQEKLDRFVKAIDRVARKK